MRWSDAGIQPARVRTNSVPYVGTAAPSTSLRAGSRLSVPSEARHLGGLNHHRLPTMLHKHRTRYTISDVYPWRLHASREVGKQLGRAPARRGGRSARTERG